MSLRGRKTALMVIALDLYFKGLSLRNISDHLWQVYGIEKSPSTLHRWITRMTKKLNEAASNIHVEVGDKWLADETVVKVAGEAMYLWNIMDYETRHYIVSVLSKRRDSEEALKVIREAILRAGKIPKKIVTDGLKAYSKALRQLEKLSIEHVSNVGLAKKENNNRIERLHGTIKDWIGRRRNLRNVENAKILLEGYRAYYNTIRPITTISKSRRKLAALLLNVKD
ncbi:IS6 family transposase [Archaeoglobales archaeon]|nr:MAG: IS6 family transposase [Archaeoglobales archaeon]